MKRNASMINIAKALCVLIIMLCGSLAGYARQQQDNGVEDDPIVQVLSGTSLVTNATAFTAFTKRHETSSSIINIISLRVNEETPLYIPGDFDATVKLKIEYGDDVDHLNTIAEQNFTVSYKKAQRSKYNTHQYFHFAGAKYVRITVLDVPATSVGSIAIKNLLVVENEMRVTRYDVLSNNVQPLSFTTSSPVDGDDELTVNWSWPLDSGYTHTQLEWTWLEKEMASYYYVNGSLNYDLLFRNNATRIDLPGNIDSYRIPLLYGDTGKLYCRIRAVNIRKNGGRSDGPWSILDSSSFVGHQPNLNWQASVSFAEEGKRKAVIQYFDGSLRSRQTVTKDNVTNTTVIAETFYDREGRPAVQILPAPGTGDKIKYMTNLNLFKENTLLGLPDQPDNADFTAYFDLQPATPSSMVPALQTGSGSSLYYSTANPQKDAAPYKQVPDAEGYPYTVTRYTPDATGRIQAQSGVGAAMQMGKGHEIKYYYGTAAQEELDGLFGTEAGNNTHYLKQMMKDPNGQMSVSYTDMHGHTIATALAGDAPANMTSLQLNATHYPKQAGTTITRNLLNSSTNIVKNNSIEAINTLLVPATTLHKFTYSLQPDTLELISCNASQICFDCMYDLEISFTEESGDLAPITRRYNNINLNADHDRNTGVQGFKDSAGNLITGNIIKDSIILQPGSWTVRKTLTISEASLQKQKEAWLQVGLCKTEEQLIDSLKTVLETITGCNNPPGELTCSTCLTDLGDSATYRNNYIASIGNPSPVSAALAEEIRLSWLSAKALCGRLCNTTSQQSFTKRQLMLADMMPYGGQYARDTGTSDTYKQFNIFSTDHAGQPFFRDPQTGNQAGAHYYTLQGQEDPINGELSTITPDNFTAAFQHQWAEALLPHHPEYARLQFAENNLQDSYNWINTFQQTETWAAAELANYILFSGNTTATPNNDPFYAEAPSSYKTAMETKVKTNFRTQDDLTLSMWQIAYGDVRCKTIVNLNSRKDCYDDAPKQPAASLPSPFNSLTTAEKDQVWVTFRGLYANEREKQVNQYIVSSVPIPEADQIVAHGYKLHFPSEEQMVRQYNGNGEWDWYPENPGEGPPEGSVPENADAVYSGRCASYITTWKRALEQCPALNAHAQKEQILTEITTQMAAVCEKGSDAANPYGSSSVAPGTPNDGSPRNFEEVINNVFDFYNIDKSTVCNPYVIEFPKPYGKGPEFTKSAITVLDTCNCKRFAQLKNEALAAEVNINSLSALNAYFLATYGDTITTTLYNAFSSCNLLGYQSACRTVNKTVRLPCDTENPCGISTFSANSTFNTNAIDCGNGYHYSEFFKICIPNGVEQRCPIGWKWDPVIEDCVRDLIPIEMCDFQCPELECEDVPNFYIPLPTPQPLPAFMKCGDTIAPRCLSCAMLSELTLAFRDSFDLLSAPVIDSNYTSEQISYNILYERFLNARTGLQYTWLEYALAAANASCSLSSPAGNTGATQIVICADPKPLNDTTGVLLVDDPCQQAYNMAVAWAHQIYEARRDSLLADFETRYRAKCLAAKDMETFTVTYAVKEYHYTLYYYDMAGNLVKTVSPKGARPNFTQGFLDSVRIARGAGNDKTPPHIMVTDYRYNSLNLVVEQHSPDGGTSHFWYDRLGRLVVSQNTRQANDNNYSYTLYDNLGRITEVGQKPQTTPMTQVISQDATTLTNWILNSGGVREQITATMYDLPYVFQNNTYLTQRNLRNRVSFTAIWNKATDERQYAASFYTYDVHGNVDTLLQDYCGVPVMKDATQGFKKIIYDYNLISGKVNMVSYQAGRYDAFYHRYQYDAENRLTEVATSRDKIMWEREAAYQYYKHGPLARTELGAQRVQGLDYAYTLQGWLKGLNTTATGNTGLDIGRDGLPIAGHDNAVVARDVLGFALHYYDATEGSDQWLDYKPIAGSGAFARPATSASGFVSLYNGNIGAISINNAGLKREPQSGINPLPLLFNYRYDQLNRIVSMKAYKGLDAGLNKWTPVSISDYQEAITYDPNGNILSYQRNGTPSTGRSTAMDALTYFYDAYTNRLNHVTDTVSPNNYAVDLDSQPSNNYRYDTIGNLIADNAAGIDTIKWTVYGKIASIIKGDSTIEYTYDPAGNRISKTANGKTTIYVRDATGNVMSIYEKPAATPLKQIETHLYGSSRLGMTTVLTKSPDSVDLNGGYARAALSTFTRGEKIFEVSNHLGNVLATITDRKLQHTADSTNRDYYEPDILTAVDYYPFGMMMPGRGITDSAVAECEQEWQDATELVASSDLNSDVVQDGTSYYQNGVRWGPMASSSISWYNNQAMKCTNNGGSSDGIVAHIPASAVEPNTTYVLEFDIVEKSPGITYFTCQGITPTDDAYRVTTRKTGVGRHSILFTTPENLPAYVRLRITSNVVTAGTYYIVDNFTARKFNITEQALTTGTNFSSAVMSGKNILADDMVWMPLNSTINSVGLTGTVDKKIRVNCTTVDEAYLKTEFALAGGRNYIMRFTFVQDSVDKRLSMRVYARTGGVWSLTETQGMFYIGSGKNMINFTHPAGADSARVEFVRSNSGQPYDGYNTPYTMDDFSITILDTIGSQPVTVCEGCHQEMQDMKEFKASSNLDNGVTQSGNDFLHNGVLWRAQSTATISLYNQAIKVVNSGGGSDGVLALPSLALVEPNTTYIMECDIIEQSPGVTEFGIYASDNTGAPYRVSSVQAGLGHHSIIFTTGATLGTYLTFRVSARPITAGLYFVVDNFVFKKYKTANQSQYYGTDFSSAIMSGVNVNDNGQLFKPLQPTITSLSLTDTVDKKIQVNCTNSNDSRLITDLPVIGGKRYLLKFSMEQALSDKRVYVDIMSRLGGGSFTYTETRSVYYTGSGNYQINFSVPAAADQIRVIFLRNNTGSPIDGLNVPYTIDNFSITHLEPVDSLSVLVCEGSGTSGDNGIYRYGFNGKENDNEVKGEGNQQDYGMRIYDPRLGRFLSVDPLIQDYPWYTPYQFAGNKPIMAVDLDGLEEHEEVSVVEEETGRTNLRVAWKEGNGKVVYMVRNQNMGVKVFKVATALGGGILNIIRNVFSSPSTSSQDVARQSYPRVQGTANEDKFWERWIGPGRNFPLPPIGAQERAEWLAKYWPEGLPINLPRSIPIPQVESKAVDDEEKDDGYITLYRGVGEDIRPYYLYELAKQGTAIPKGLLPGVPEARINLDENMHTGGDNVSIWTSWTSDESMAEYFARGPMGTSAGVVLSKRFKRDQLTVSKNASLMQEGEYLVPGIVTGANTHLLDAQNRKR